MSVTGHKTAAMVSLYVEDANKRVQSSAAILKLQNAPGTKTGKHAKRKVANGPSVNSKPLKYLAVPTGVEPVFQD